MNFFYGTILGKNDKLYFQDELQELLLPDAWKQKLEAYIEKKVIFGARPEDIGSEQAEKGGTMPKIKAKVEVTEPMGSETYLYMNTGCQSFISRVDAHRILRVDENIELSVFIPKAHVFDGETDKLIV
jgi:multiple sugar transport system ATP-binding protein